MTVKLNLNNKIINGAMEYWQRGTSFASIANNAYHTDRFHYIKTGTMVHTVQRSTDVPTSAFGTYSLYADVTTAQSPLLVGSYVGILQHIEGNVLRTFKGKKMVLTFWVKAFKTGTYCVALRNGNSTKAYIMEYTVNASNVWEKKTLRFTHDTSGTWSYNTSIGITIVWTIASGSTFHTSPNTWANGNFLATSNQVNGVDNVANDFYLADICLVEDNEGQTREPDFKLAGRDVFEELQLCQRYYQAHYANRRRISGTQMFDGFELLVPMRVFPIGSGNITDNGTLTISDNNFTGAPITTLYILGSTTATAGGTHTITLFLDSEL